MNLALNFINYYCSIEKLNQTLNKKGGGNKKGRGAKLRPVLVSGIVTGDVPVTIFFPSLVPVPEVLTKCSFLFVTKVTSVQVGHVAAAQKLKTNKLLVCYPNWKTMVNNELPLSKRMNQERPYEQLLHYWSRHLQVVLEQFRLTSTLFNQHLGVLVSAPKPHLHPKIP